MLKVICDRCERESDQDSVEMGNWREIKIPCHIVEDSRSVAYVDNEMVSVSGRLTKFDLCAKCVNAVYGAAFKAIKDQK